MKIFLQIEILILICLVFIFPFRGFALTETEVKNQIKETNKQIEAIEKEIASLSNKISKTATEKASLAKAIKELNLTRNQLIKEKELIQKKISNTGIIINKISSDITEKESDINISKKTLSKLFKELYQNESKSFLEIFLEEKGFSDFSTKYNEILEVNEKIKNNIFKINNKKQELVLTKNQKEEEQSKLKNLKNNLLQKEQVVLINKKEKDELLTKTQNKETKYQELLAEQIKKRDAFEKDLEKYEDQLKFIVNKKIIPKDYSEVFAWPLKNVFITQLFGYTSDSKRLYRSGTHSGLDLRASIGTEVFAMADGVVEGVGDTDIYCKGASFGKWVFIRYNNGLSSTYGHLSLTYAKKGDKVKAGDLVALSGNTGHSTGPHLHVTVYASDGVKVDKVPSISCSGKTFIMPIAASTSYLDPMLYLPKTTAIKKK